MPLFLRRSRAASFADIIKIAYIFIKTTFKDSKELIRNYEEINKEIKET